MTELTALVPMKGHSERVPGKNLRDFNGQPLLAAILSTLADCARVCEILVNTDDEQIASAARSVSDIVTIVKRPKQLCGDLVSMNRIIEHDLTRCSTEHILQTHATNPLLGAASISRAVDRYFELISADQADSLFSVTRLQTRLYWTDGAPINHDPEVLVRTQDLAPVFEENSCLYLFSRESFHASGRRRIGHQPAMYETPALESLDIDYESDFQIALAVSGILSPHETDG